MGRDPYRCSDGEPLFVDYKDNGLQIDLRRFSSAVPMTLTAPAQGLQYVGKTATATFKGSQLTVVEGEGAPGPANGRAPDEPSCLPTCRTATGEKRCLTRRSPM
jgi:hypothetical protein